MTENAKFWTIVGTIGGSCLTVIATVIGLHLSMIGQISDVRSEISDVRSEVSDVRAELLDQISDVRAEVSDVRERLARIETLLEIPAAAPTAISVALDPE